MEKRINAGILQLTLGIALIIASVCGSILLVAYYQKLHFTEQSINELLNENCSSGMQYFLAKRSGIAFNSPIKEDLYGEGSDSVEVIRKPWGLYEVAYVRAWRGKKTDSKTALITSTSSKEGEASLYVPDRNSPLYLVGDTKIEGTVYLSDRKFSTGHIDGKDFSRSRLFEGQAKKSLPSMPALDTNLVSKVKQILTAEGKRSYSLNQMESLKSGYYPFAPSASLFESRQAIELRDSIMGGVVILSLIKIRVTSSAKLEDVILIAPFIDIDKGFEGTLQCFATRQITVGSDSKLHYPSSLTLIGGENDSSIVVQRNAIVKGMILIPGYLGVQDKGILKIEKGAIFQGSAYVNGAAQVDGTSSGNLIAYSMQVARNSVVYSDHVMDASIVGSVFSGVLPGSLSWTSGKEMLIAKWIR